MKTVIFTGGGTLGHLYPAVAVIKKLKHSEPDTRIIYLSTDHEKELTILRNTPEIDEIYPLKLEGIKRSLSFRNLRVFKDLLAAVKEAKAIIGRTHPDLVVGMGGYISGAVVYAAGKKHVPAIIHEQNATIGLANRLSMPFAKRMLLSFPIASKSKKICFIGHPRKDQVEEMLKGLKPAASGMVPKILITSGSGGARRVNEVAIEFLSDPCSHTYNVTLVTGPKYFDEIREKLHDVHGDHYQIVPFIENLPRAMFDVDVVVTRCGSTTIFELLGAKTPGIYIPSPNVVGNHQEKNAFYLSKYHMGEVILERNLTKEVLFSRIGSILSNPNAKEELKQAIKGFSDRNALDLFLQEIKKWW